MSETEPKNDFVYKKGPKCPRVRPFTPKTKQNLNLNTLLHREVMGKRNWMLTKGTLIDLKPNSQR